MQALEHPSLHRCRPAPALLASLLLTASPLPAAAQSSPGPHTASHEAPTPRSEPADSEPQLLTPTEVLHRCLSQRYGYDFLEQIRIVQKEERSDAERNTELEMMQKNIEGRLHSLVRFTHPDALRGTRVLTIERDDRSDDHFAFLRSQQKIRRVRSRRSDSFVGTDFTMEDLEKREVSDFEILGMQRVGVEGEPAYQVRTRPLYDSAYARLDYVIASRDFTTLGIRYYKEGADAPFKEMVVPRESIQTFRDGLHLGLHAYVKDYRRKTETHVFLENVTIDPELPDSLFSTSGLHLDRKVKGLD